MTWLLGDGSLGGHGRVNLGGQGLWVGTGGGCRGMVSGDEVWWVQW